MTPWDRLRDRIANGMSDQDRRRWVLVGVPALIALVVVAAISPWEIWPVVAIAIWLVVLGAVVYVAVRLALRHR